MKCAVQVFPVGILQVGWNGVFAPKGTPAAVVTRLVGVIDSIMAKPDMKARIVRAGVEPGFMTGLAFVKFMHEDMARFGRGVTQRLLQSRLKLGQVNALFLTHLHSDHVVGIPDLWLTGWLQAAFGQRKTPFQVYGPEGTRSLMEGLGNAYDWDIKTRLADQKLPPEGVAVQVTEFEEGVVFEKNGVKVTSFQVDHGDLINPAFGFRIDYGGRSVVISGDTRRNENLIKHAKGVDLLIHQVAAARPALLKIPVFKVIEPKK